MTSTVLVTGATGFIGRALIAALRQRGDRIIALTRNHARATRLLGGDILVCTDLDSIAASEPIDIVVNLAGEPLIGGLWTAARRRRFIDSRVATTTAVLQLLGRLQRPPSVLINGSAVGFYGDGGETVLTEASEAQPIFISEICRKWEARAQAARNLGIRVVRLRTGLVLDLDGGALPPLLMTTRLGFGTILGSGRQFLSWIHRRDLVRMILFAIDNSQVEGPINGVAPVPVRYRDFMKSLGKALGRPVFLRVPAFILRLALGGLADLFLISQQVQPEKPLALGFSYDFPTLEAALQEIVSRA
ncbi:MAG TPA: TIGR01777 family oxidoreductase [Stellaceae bacterium]|jgi:uncharacterized protein (TIGR01777 family)|nr:TIGR01777 family oxidoreductase [Stellaceae bacterium]